MWRIIPVLMLLAAYTANTTVLSDAAASMQAGEWKVLSTNGFGNGNIMVPLDQGCGAGDYVTQYAENAAWDPIKKRVLFYGATHGNCYAQRLIIYTESDNNWVVGPLHPSSCSGSSGCFSHGYDHSTVDPSTGDFWYREYGGNVLYKYGATSNAWTTTSTVTENIVRANGTCCNAIVYYPEMHGIVFSAGNGGTGAGTSQVGFYNPSTSAWSSISTGIGVGDYNNMIQYNPVLKTVLFGGGSGFTRTIYKLTATGTGTGTITKMAATPVDIGLTSCVLTVDPASGKYLVLSGTSFYEYDMTADSWKTLSTQVPAILRSLSGYGDGLIETPIAAYGVIMFIKWNFASSVVYLYKHSAGTTVETAVQSDDVAGLGISATPNPLRISTEIHVTGIAAKTAAVSVYDLIGRRITTLKTSLSNANAFTWNAGTQPAGVYLLRVQNGTVRMVKAVTVIR